MSATFAGAIIAALIFLFGFVLATASAPPDILAAIGSSVVLSTLALVAYTNASGELARIRAGSFTRYMEVANVVSEFAGVYPLFILTPAIVVAKTHASVASLVLAIASGVTLLLYQYVGLDLIHRYERRRHAAWSIYRWLLAALPLLAYVSWLSLGKTWPWTVLMVVALAGGAVVCLNSAGEASL